MQKVDEKLLRLYKHLQNHEFIRDDVATLLAITPRQLSRLLKKWEQEGLLHYQVGVGRGVLSEIKFDKNIEHLFVNYTVNHIKEYTFEEITEILTMPLHQVSKELITSVFNAQLVLHNDEGEIDEGATYVDYIYRIPDDLDPLLQSDMSKDTIIYNIMDRLYEVNYDLRFTSNVVSHETLHDNQFTMYLHHYITFSDGTMLSAQQVVDCLERFRTHPDHADKFKGVRSVTAQGLFNVTIMLDEPYSADYIKFILAQSAASLYRVREECFIGTGAYVLHQMKESFIQLEQRRSAHHEFGDIQQIYLVKNYQQYLDNYENVETKDLEKQHVLQRGYLMFHPCSTKLNVKKRKIIADAVHHFFDCYAKKEAICDYNGPVITDEVILGLFSLKDKAQLQLIQFLNQTGFNVKYECISFDKVLSDELTTLPCDFCLMSYTNIEQLYYVSLLTMTNIKKLQPYFCEDIEQSNFARNQRKDWIATEEIYKEHLESNYWINPIKTLCKNKVIPIDYKNIHVNNDGILIYNKIIVVE
ncbi:SgrR family transcriptional regulator [Macrococcus equi]|uniref:SgrR family transcriptional regulator n=1 Tax=Macrococcus equi TaxID=3395462 RepID=UPI0039BE9CA0